MIILIVIYYMLNSWLEVLWLLVADLPARYWLLRLVGRWMVLKDVGVDYFWIVILVILLHAINYI